MQYFSDYEFKIINDRRHGVQTQYRALYLLDGS